MNYQSFYSLNPTRLTTRILICSRNCSLMWFRLAWTSWWVEEDLKIDLIPNVFIYLNGKLYFKGGFKWQSGYIWSGLHKNSNNYWFFCSLCGFASEQFMPVDLHMSEVHAEPEFEEEVESEKSSSSQRKRNYSCKYCGKQFTKIKRKKLHENLEKCSGQEYQNGF
jgi:hypothetical protein